MAAISSQQSISTSVENASMAETCDPDHAPEKDSTMHPKKTP